MAGADQPDARDPDVEASLAEQARAMRKQKAPRGAGSRPSTASGAAAPPSSPSPSAAPGRSGWAAGWAHLRAGFSARDPALLVPTLASIAIALGVLWRFVALAYPATFTFDEYHFVENARNYLVGAADWNDHPPLGKLLIMPGILVFGDNGVGWRVHEAVLGVLHIALVALVAHGIFASRRAAWMAAAFVAVDGLFVAYSRTALLDIPMNAFMMAALALMLRGRHLAWFAGAAIALGLAVAVKWIAVSLALAVPLFLWRQRRSIFHSLWMGVVAVAVYGAVVALALVATHQSVSLSGIVTSSRNLLKHHAGFTDWQNPADSRWYTWFYLWKPIMLFRANLPDHMVRLTSTVGNPLLWYATTVTWVAAIFLMLRSVWQRFAAKTAVPPIVRQSTLVVITGAALLLQWVLTHRESYIWHYMGTYSLGLMLLAAVIDRETLHRPRAAGACLLAVMAVSVFYSPVWTNGLLSRTSAGWRLFMPLWR